MEQPQGEKPTTSDLSKEGVQGFFQSYWNQAKSVLMSPRVFFDSMPVEGGLKDPLIFLAVSAGVNSLGLTIKSNLAIGAIAFIGTLVLCLLGALVTSFIAQSMMAGKGTYEATFRVMAYSEAGLLLAWIPWVGWLISLYIIALNFLGFKKIHELNDVKAALLVIVSGILTFLVVGLAACGVAIRHMLHF